MMLILSLDSCSDPCSQLTCIFRFLFLHFSCSCNILSLSQSTEFSCFHRRGPSGSRLLPALTMLCVNSAHHMAQRSSLWHKQSATEPNSVALIGCKLCGQLWYLVPIITDDADKSQKPYT
eukprot:1313274-Rhodomonas_salina.2